MNNNKIYLKKIVTDFQRYSKNLLNTSYEESEANFIRFKKYIDENELINSIIKQKIESSQINYEDCFLTINNSWGEDYIIPNDESDHLKAIYDYMCMIEEKNIDILNIASLYICSDKQAVDIVHNFIKKIISPLIDYINIELSKKLMEYDEYSPSIYFNGSNSPVYFQSNGNQKVNYNINDKELFDLVISKIDLLKQEGLSNDKIKEIKELCKNKDKNKLINCLKEISSGVISSVIATGILSMIGL